MVNLRNNAHFAFAFAAIILIGISVRLIGISTESLRLDEAQSIWQASHSMEFIRQYMLKNVHLPLHNTLLHVWMQFFGTSEASVRMLAAIPGILFLPAIYLLAREFMARHWALVAMTLASIAPIFVWYSREIRMYSLLILIATLSFYLYIRILREPRMQWYLLYTAVNLIGIYTHYFFIWTLVVQLIFFFATWNIDFTSHIKKTKRQIFIGLSVVAGLLLIAFSPWLYGLFSSHGSGSLAPVFGAPNSFNMALTLFEFLFGFQPDIITGGLFALWPLITLFGFIFLAKRTPIPPLVWLLVIGIFLPITLTFIISVTIKPLYLTRYLMIAAPLVFVFITWFISELPKYRVFFTLAIATVLVCTLYTQQFHPESPAKENYRDVATYINAEVTSRDIVVLAPPYLIYPFQYYYTGQAHTTSMPIWDKREGAIPVITPELLARDAEIIKGSRKRIFLIVGSDLVGANEAKDYFDSNLTKIDKKQFSKNLWLHVYQAEYLTDNQDVVTIPPPSPSSTPVPTSEHTTQTPSNSVSNISGTYVIQQGDTLTSISKKIYGDSSKYLYIAELNGIVDPNTIILGRTLLTP